MKDPIFTSQEEMALCEAAISRLHAALAQRGMRYYIESYGCQMNDYDAQKLAGMLRAMGCEEALDKESADILLFNTCCVREHAELRVFGNIGALKKVKEARPDLIIGVCGCMMQQKEVSERLYRRFPFVDLIFGTHELHRFPILFESMWHGERVLAIREIEGEIAEGLPIQRKESHFSSVTIAYGCDNYCSYCIVPYVRGRERSRNVEDILTEVRQVALAGYSEVMLLGQNVNSYQGNGGTVDFAGLLRQVHEVDEIARIRFMTSHPKDLSPQLITAMAELPKVCRHLHLPVQSGSDKVLLDMNRNYTRQHYLDEVAALRAAIPDIELSTDIIVGFPGETEEDFADTLRLMEEVGFSAAYTFMYSKRTGTRAAEMEGQVSEEMKKQRLMELNALQARITQAGNLRYVGSEGVVLVEGCDLRNPERPMAYGKLSNGRMVYFPGNESLIRSMQHVRITATQSNSLIGELLEP